VDLGLEHLKNRQRFRGEGTVREDDTVSSRFGLCRMLPISGAV